MNVTVSTAPLKKIVQKSHPGADVRVIHNGLSSRWVRQGRYMYQKDYEDKIIGYFPGTSTHHYDFKIVEPALVRFLEKHKAIRLLILGPLKIDEKKYDSQQLLLFPAVSYEQLPYWIKQCWITIAPLQPSLFNHCKSGLKFFESAIWGVPLIATEIPDLIRCGTELRFAEDEQGWLDQFEMMLADAPYTKISKKIENWTTEHCMAQNQLPQWLEFVNQRRYREN
jgi:glycosyltransferase involved in cell wall biosynthesis